MLFKVKAPFANSCSRSRVCTRTARLTRTRPIMSAISSKTLFNSPDDVVYELLDALVETTPFLQRLDGYPDIKVVFDDTHDKSKHVAVISGGGSGHEPAHAGYVGSAMLTAAVAGDVFASPSVEAVLAAIRQVTGPPGCLLVVKNYTGDRLHFGLARERAQAEGLSVEMVFVGEDVAISTPGLAGRRGLAGTVFVHKAAGAAAVAGAPLSEVAAVAQRVADSMATLGVALKVCTLPGKPAGDRIPEGEIEIGLGIHGEPGHSKAPAMCATPLVGRLLQQISASPFLELQPGDRVAVLVNNLGTTTPMEMGIVAGAALAELRGPVHQLSVQRIYTGSFVTSLDMAGISLTLLKLGNDDSLLTLLDAPVGAPAWPAASAVVGPAPKKPVPVPKPPANAAVQDGGDEGASSSEAPTEAGLQLSATIKAIAESLIAAAEELNALDKKVGDGDCGDTAAMGARAILADLSSYPVNNPAATLFRMAGSLGHSVGGTSGGLYEVALTAAGRSMKASGHVPGSVASWSVALQGGVDAVQRYGGATAGCRTMLDALLPAAHSMRESTAAGHSGSTAAAAAAASAAEGVIATQTMTALAGRASYVPAEVLASVPDPGAKAVEVWLSAVARVLAGSS